MGGLRLSARGFPRNAGGHVSQIYELRANFGRSVIRGDSKLGQIAHIVAGFGDVAIDPIRREPVSPAVTAFPAVARIPS